MSKISILDGGLGQEIQKRSKKTAHPLWSVMVMLEKPEIVLQVHKDFIKNGSRVICLNTYTATITRMNRYGLGDKLETVHKTAINLALQSINESKLKKNSLQLAGCLPPLVSSYISDDSMDYEKSLDEYRHLVDYQKKDVDLFLIETMSNTEEALAAINAVRETEKPVYLSFTLDDNNSKKLRSGENLTVAIDKISKELPNGIMLNCSFPETITSAMPTLAKLNIPFGGYANGFKSIEPLTSGSTVDYLSARIDLTPEIYFNFVEQWINEGATIIGGCCEIGPEHIGYICNILESNGHRLSKLPI